MSWFCLPRNNHHQNKQAQKFAQVSFLLYLWMCACGIYLHICVYAWLCGVCVHSVHACVYVVCVHWCYITAANMCCHACCVLNFFVLNGEVTRLTEQHTELKSQLDALTKKHQALMLSSKVSEVPIHLDSCVSFCTYIHIHTQHTFSNTHTKVQCMYTHTCALHGTSHTHMHIPFHPSFWPLYWRLIERLRLSNFLNEM